jgi:hypothetical protein
MKYQFLRLVEQHKRQRTTSILAQWQHYPRLKMCVKLNVYRPQESTWKPPLPQYATTLAVMRERQCSRTTKLEKRILTIRKDKKIVTMKLVRPEKLNLLTHKVLNENWVQQVIAEDPSILGLGDLILKDKERIHPKAGRLDLLLQDVESKRRYEVEIQLGKVDESHIIRTIEYWDIERKRYPQYDHCAVIIAEDITSRFLNVIGLFNGFIPLIAIQMSAYQISENEVSLMFTTVLDEMNLGMVEEDEETKEITDRNYWENRGTKQTVALADSLLDVVKEFSPDLELKYNKYYIGLAKNGQPNNFAIFRAKKSSLLLEIRLKQSPEIQEKLDNAKLDTLDYESKWGRYRVRLDKGDIVKHRELLKELMMQSYGVITDE